MLVHLPSLLLGTSKLHDTGEVPSSRGHFQDDDTVSLYGRRETQPLRSTFKRSLSAITANCERLSQQGRASSTICSSSSILMLANPLLRRIHCHNAWPHNYQLRLKRAVVITNPVRRYASRARSRQAGTIRRPIKATQPPPPPPVFDRSAGVNIRQPVPDAEGAKKTAVITQQAQELKIKAERLLLDHDEIMIYEAPAHGSLMVSSLLGGSMFSNLALTTATGIMTPGSFSLLMQVPVVCGSMLGLCMGITMLVTTMRTIQSVRLIRTPDQELKLRFDTKWRIYFWEPKRIEVSIDQVSADRRISDTDTAYFAVNLEDRFKWTEWADNHPPSFSVGGFLRSMKEGLANFASVTARDVGRMFLRRGMMTVRIDDKNWKMDLWHAQLLDQGKVFASLVREDQEIKNSVLGIIRRTLSGS